MALGEGQLRTAILQHYLLIGCMAGVLVGSLLFLRWWIKQAQTDGDTQSDWVFGITVFMGLTAFVAVLVLVIAISELLARVNNPDYHAIRYALQAIQGLGY